MNFDVLINSAQDTFVYNLKKFLLENKKLSTTQNEKLSEKIQDVFLTVVPFKPPLQYYSLDFLQDDFILDKLSDKQRGEVLSQAISCGILVVAKKISSYSFELPSDFNFAIAESKRLNNQINLDYESLTKDYLNWLDEKIKPKITTHDWALLNFVYLSLLIKTGESLARSFFRIDIDIVNFISKNPEHETLKIFQEIKNNINQIKDCLGYDSWSSGVKQILENLVSKKPIDEPSFDYLPKFIDSNFELFKSNIERYEMRNSLSNQSKTKHIKI